MRNGDDKDQSLHKLSLHHRASIVSQLVDIGNECNQQEHLKHLYFIEQLQCLQPKGTQLRRTSINAFRNQQYVALSYTWESSKYEDDEFGRYHIQDWDRHRYESSEVRDCVFDRVLRYMHHKNVPRFWIDRHCIRQDACDLACTHARCAQKRDAMQAMDLVYQLSEHPIALLGREIHTTSELYLLARILSGKLVNADLQPQRPRVIHEARKALRLLHDITQDLWWGRAWTFQENYRGGQWMQLLIRHVPSLEAQKLRYGVFGRIPGELCVPSVTFSKKATRLCLALRQVTGELPSNEISHINDVLRAAGRYEAMLPESSPMTPTVIADIEARGLSKPWDRLAIIANCCQYPVRLDFGELSRQGRSLSLSVLAMCLLNGEILDNNDDDLEPVASLTTSNFLQKQMFKAFIAPEHDTRRLSYNKSCRLANVELTSDGILTEGHLWKLGHIVDTSMFSRKLPWIDKPNDQLELDQQKRLQQLADYLYDLETPLADWIHEYLAGETSATPFTKTHLNSMASELAAAIQARRKLRLGSLWDPKGRLAPYRGVFVLPDEHNDKDEAYPQPAFVFTSISSRDPGSDTHDPNDIHRHVSVEVGLEEPLFVDGPPHLRVRRWLLGMCFFDRCPLTEVVFPWPRALQEVRSQ